ncbi:MAG TPA: TerC family protein, partial [Arthrobacter sp.]|nr:TerC family protein [Arthrobacter sp.]
DGQPVPVIEITTATSLTVIVGVLVLTVVASLLSKAGKAQTSINNARRHAVNYLDLEYTADAAERERIYRMLTDEESQILAMDPKYRNKAKDIDKIRALVAEAHRQHEEYLAR